MESGLANLALGLGIGRDVRYFPFDFPMKSSQSGNADVISKETSNLFILPPTPHQITHTTCIYQTCQSKRTDIVLLVRLP